ncbi:MAG: hypothetical protein L7V86_08850 [Verrucomicrobiales bacterium]|nr:hypothetical protein [Verrucomicrobiales bacterium]
MRTRQAQEQSHSLLGNSLRKLATPIELEEVEKLRRMIPVHMTQRNPSDFAPFLPKPSTDTIPTVEE